MKEIPVVIKLLEDISFLTSYPLFYPCDPRLLHWQLPRLTDKAPLASCLPYVPPQASCTDSYFECFFATACRGAKMFWTSLSKIKEGERHTNGHPKRKIVPPVSLLSQVLGSLSGWGGLHLTTQEIAHEIRVPNANHKYRSVLIMITYFLHFKLTIQTLNLGRIGRFWRDLLLARQNQATRLSMYSQCSSCPNKPL